MPPCIRHAAHGAFGLPPMLPAGQGGVRSSCVIRVTLAAEIVLLWRHCDAEHSPVKSPLSRTLFCRAYIRDPSMVTRRTLLKQGAYTALALRTAPVLIGVARAQTADPASFDFYISPNGSDSNPGTQSQPWAITAINTHQADYAGKRVGLLDGSYNVHALCQAGGLWNGPALAVNGGPSATSPTVIAAINPRQAILTAADPASGAYPSKACPIIGQGYMQTKNKGNVIIDGLYLTRSFQYAIAFYAPVGQQQEGGATGFVVRNCEIYDIGGIVNDNVGGILTWFCTGALISNNKIHNVQPPNIHNANLAQCRGNFLLPLPLKRLRIQHDLRLQQRHSRQEQLQRQPYLPLQLHRVRRAHPSHGVGRWRRRQSGRRAHRSQQHFRGPIDLGRVQRLQYAGIAERGLFQ